MMSGRSARGRRAVGTALVVLTGLTIAGCTDFSDQASPGTFTPQSQLAPESPPAPEGPGDEGGGSGGAPQPSQSAVPPPQGCADFHPNVIGTCLAAISSVAALPGSDQQPSALAAEQATGSVLQVSKGTKPTQLAKLNVDGSGDGGLTGLALSPSYAQDQLMYAYVTTDTDNEVVRFAAGQPAKTVLGGIPKGSTDNRGALALDHKGALLIATGDAGNAAAAANPKSLAGKILRIAPDGTPAPDNPDPHSAVIASGVHEPGGLCATSDGAASYITERGGSRDQLFRIQPGQPLRTPTWSWTNRPGVAGCSATANLVTVNTSTAGNMQGISLNGDGSVNGTPQIAFNGPDGYGKLTGMDLLNDDLVVVGTANKAGGKPVSSDDRVVIIPRQSVGGSGKD